MFVDTWIHRFSILEKKSSLNILWGSQILKIALPTKYTKLNVQKIKVISQYAYWTKNVRLGHYEKSLQNNRNNM